LLIFSKGAAGVMGLSHMVPTPSFIDRSIGVVIGSSGFIFLADQGDQNVLWIALGPSDSPYAGRSIYTKASEIGKEQVKKDESERQAELRQLAHKIVTEYPDELHKVVDSTAPNSIRVFNFYDKLPHRAVGRVVFVGDSTHPGTPLSGNGANLALVSSCFQLDMIRENFLNLFCFPSSMTLLFLFYLSNSSR
jgi:hypothetical protein